MTLDDYRQEYAELKGFNKWCELKQSYLDNPLYRYVPEFVYFDMAEKWANKYVFMAGFDAGLRENNQYYDPTWKG